MPPLPLIPNMPAGMTDINWGAMNPSSYGAPATNDPYTAVNEARKRSQMESDREYELRVKEANRRREEIAIKKGEAAANKWYQQQMVQISKDKLVEDQRQFNVTSSGYLDNGQNTLARDQFQDDSLQSWTAKAIDLGSRPEDWVKYKRYTSGVGNNLGSIPGLSWTAGGQQGNTTAQGEHPTSSLGNVMTAMGIANGGNWASSAANQAAQGNVAMTPSEQQIYQTANEFAANPQGAAPGWWDELDTDTKDLIKGAAEAQGHSWASVMSRFNRSRWGGGGSAVAA